ncbi:MAG: alanyl-tRNA editing protein [Rhodobacteraceae bacterium]|nr:alanyl-tRNA editing protein [Paracoccaceae bacterium]
MTEFLFREDAYRLECDAKVTAAGPEGVELDRTVFYADSGGQPGDSGWMAGEDGVEIAVTGAVHPGGDRTRVLHLMAPEAPRPAPGTALRLRLDRDRRHRLMRMHTALHLLSVVMPYPVTGGAIGEARGRLDFDMPEPPADLVAIAAQLNAYVAADLPVFAEWIAEAELDASPALVKTMKVKPPRGQGRVRLVRIGTGADTVDLQPCGGTHVRATGEIGPLALGKIEKKGRENRRVYLHFAATCATDS